MAEHTVIGKRPPRIDALDKATGAALFSADIVLPNMLHGKVLRSPVPHARITRLDTSKAMALPGVMAIVTSADVPAFQNDDEILMPMVPTLAKKRVIFAGQPVAAVAAKSQEVAEEAIGLIEVEYEVLPFVIDVLEAMKLDAPLIYPSLQVGSGPGKRAPPAISFSPRRTLAETGRRVFARQTSSSKIPSARRQCIRASWSSGQPWLTWDETAR